MGDKTLLHPTKVYLLAEQLVEKLGIVYSPVEVVDFIIHSVADILQKEFGRDISEENIHILIGSQEDPAFLAALFAQTGPIDILIDDGGHTQRQQRISFEHLFKQIKPNGVYLCEDTHTSYWNTYGGGHKRKDSFTEYAKNLIDLINAHHSEEPSLQVTEFTRTANTIHFYDSVIVIEKKERPAPQPKMTGVPSFPSQPEKKTFLEKIQLHWLLNTNKLLQKMHLPGYQINRMIELSSKL